MKKIIGYSQKGIPIVVTGVKHPRDPLQDVKNLFWESGEGTVAWMKNQVRRLGFRGYSRLSKAELQDILANNRKPPARTWKDLTKNELKVLARSRNIEVNSRSTKAQLIDAISQSEGEVVIRDISVDNITNKFYADVESYNSSDIDFLVDQVRQSIIDRIRNGWSNKKVRISADVELIKINRITGEVDVRQVGIWGGRRGDAAVIQQTTDLEEFISERISFIKNKVD